jgi:hypothetical protein
MASCSCDQFNTSDEETSLVSEDNADETSVHGETAPGRRPPRHASGLGWLRPTLGVDNFS